MVSGSRWTRSGRSGSSRSSGNRERPRGSAGPKPMSFWKDRNVLVTGATGLVGSTLVPRLLEKGARVAVLVRDWDPQSELIRSGAIKSCRVVSGRLESVSDVERALVENEVETVFHLGAQTVVGTGYRSPYQTFESNIRGSYTL